MTPRPRGRGVTGAMIPGARLIILGRQGAGKGTQCVRLSRHFVVPHISTGDMLRAAVREGTELGVMAKKVMDDGGLVGDEIMVGIVARAAARTTTPADAATSSTAFPRTVGQAEAARRDHPRAADRRGHRPRRAPRPGAQPDQCPSGVRRLRHQLRGHGDGEAPWICDVCGGDVMQRDDDTPEAINHRLDLYEEQTAPLIEYYQRTERLVVVDGVATPDEVFHRLDRRRRARRVAGRRDAMAATRPPHARRAARDARRRPGGRRDARGDPRRAAPRGHHRATSTWSPATSSSGDGATSNFLGYHGYPAVICASVNDEVIHGIPGPRVLDDGDVCRSTAARSSTAGTATRRSRWASARSRRTAQRLIDGRRARRSPRRSRRCAPAATSATSARRSTAWSSAAGYGSPRDYCGHGIGRAMHEDPDVENRGRPRQGPDCSSPASCWRSSRC